MWTIGSTATASSRSGDAGSTNFAPTDERPNPPGIAHVRPRPTRAVADDMQVINARKRACPNPHTSRTGPVVVATRVADLVTACSQCLLR